MNTLIYTIYYALLVLCIISLAIGVKKNQQGYLLAALWINLISLFLYYRIAGGEILGSYFDYQNATIYSINLLVLLVIVFYLFTTTPLLTKEFGRYTKSLLSACLVIGSLLLIVNLWTNACFLDHRKPGTPIMQIALFTHPSYCAYPYVFFTIDKNNRVAYLCPNHYGLIPSVGHVSPPPDFLLKRFPNLLQEKG